MDGLLVTIALVPLAWLCFYRWLQKDQPVKGWPLLGASLELLSNYDRVYDWFTDLFRSNSRKSIRIPMPVCDYVIIVDPACIEHVLKTNFDNYPKGWLFHERMEELLGDGIFNSDGKLWRMQRKTASFEFASRVLRDFSSDVFRDYSLQLCYIIDSAASSSATIDLEELLLRMTMDSISKFGFGVDIGALSFARADNSFATAFNMSSTIIGYRFVDPFWKIKRWLNIGRERILKRHIKTLDDFTYKIISARRARINSCHAKHDILSRFLLLNEHIEDKVLRDVVLNFVIAGRDTTASSLSWFFYMLTLHPEVMAKIYEELQQIETNQPEGKLGACAMKDFVDLLTYDTITNLVYLHAAITEAIRLHPPVATDFKSVMNDDTLPDGTRVTSGDLVLYSPYVMGRMRFLWGEDACEYKPERWIHDGNFRSVSSFQFTAFQAGPRICLGKDSAYVQMKIVAALLCRFFTFDLVPKQEVKYSVNVTMRMANGLLVVPRRRE